MIPKTLKETANLPIQAFKDLDQEECNLVGELLKVKTIRDLANITYNEFVNNLSLLREAGIPKKKLELVITAAKYIVNIATYKPVEGEKVVLAGLDNAGKSALLMSINKEVGDISSLKPTQGVQRDSLMLKDQQIYIYELGGQSVYRKMYLEHPEKYILATNIMVFLIDIQDDERYEEALDYLEQLLNLVKYLGENPDFIILLHKCDPDLLKNNPMITEKIEYLSERVKKLFEPYVFQFETQISSIYNILRMSPSFHDVLSSLFTGNVEKEQEIQSIGKLLQDIVEMLLVVEHDLSEQIDIIRNNLVQLNVEVRHLSEGKPLEKPLVPLPKTSADLKPKSVFKTAINSDSSTRKALLEEMRRLFVKKK